MEADGSVTWLVAKLRGAGVLPDGEAPAGTP